MSRTGKGYMRSNGRLADMSEPIGRINKKKKNKKIGGTPLAQMDHGNSGNNAKDYKAKIRKTKRGKKIK